MPVNEGIRAEDAPACALCGRAGASLYQGVRDRHTEAPGVWNVLRCGPCGLLWLTPRPVPEDLGLLYERYYTHDSESAVTGLSARPRPIRDWILAARLGYRHLEPARWRRALGAVLALAGPLREVAELAVMGLGWRGGGTVLDVGGGNGQFLEKMRGLGWEVVGVEPDARAARGARARLGGRIHEGTLENARLPDGAVDAVTISHVIEHVPDPVATLRECRRVLRPGGQLVALTPNAESIGHRLFGEMWWDLDAPRHLHLFTCRALRAVAERAGFREVRVATTARLARNTWALNRLLARHGTLPEGASGRPGWRLHLEGVAFQLVEHLVCRVADVGEELLLIAGR